MACVILNLSGCSAQELVQKSLFPDHHEHISFPDSREVDKAGTGKKALWEIDNKYYEAQIDLLFVTAAKDDDDDDDVVQKLATRLSPQAMVMYNEVASTSDESMQVIKDFQSKLSQCDTQLLVVERFVADEDRQDVLEWCLEQGVELVDFSEEIYDEEIGDRVLNPKQRVAEALQTCPWANMKMKKDESSGKKGNTAILKDSARDATSPSIREHAEGSSSTNQDIAEENFETLFAKFADFRARAATLDGDERKKFAQTVAVSFWNALGGDQDEVEDLNSDSD